MGGLALLGLGSIAVAAPPEAAERMAGPCARLQCTDDQADELRELFAELRDDSKADREAISTLRKQLATEWAKDAPDEDAMARIEGQIRQHHEALAAMMHDTMMEVHAVLTPAQRQELAKTLEHGGFRRLFGPRHGKRGKAKKGSNGKKGKPER